MEADWFNRILESQLDKTSNMLSSKAKEYASDIDRLHNFKIAALMQRVRPQDALGGMMAKHTVSIYDMLGSDQTFTSEQWDEKITDHINYLILLKALLIEELAVEEGFIENDSASEELVYPIKEKDDTRRELRPLSEL